MTTPAADPVAIVTGGSRAIVREVMRSLTSRGYAIVLVYLRDQSRAEAAVEEVLAMGGTALVVRADLTDDLDVERLFTETIAAFGGVDAVVHTGVFGSAVLYRHAARHLRRGAAIVGLSTGEQVPPVLAQELRDREITINGAPPGHEPPGASHDVPQLIALLDRWRHRPAG